MAIDLASIKRTTAISSPRVLISGTAGVGKTTLAASAPDPVFLFCEDGAGVLEVPAFPILRSYDDFIGAIGALYASEHAYRTVVVDSVDHLEPLIWQKVCETQGIASIESMPYGKGYIEALRYWRVILDGLNALRDMKGMIVLLIAHVQIKRFESPEHDAIDRYEIKLHRSASALVQESVDCVLFAKHKVVTKTEKLGFEQSRTRGISTGERVMCTVETPAYVAKNRYGLPAELPLSWAAFENAVAAAKAALRSEQAA